MIAYKLTDQNLQTYKGYQWKLGEKRTTNGKGELCGPGWLHFYTDPRLAVILNSIHADIKNPRLFEVEVGGQCQEDLGLKIGYTEATLIKEIPLPEISVEKKVEFAIRCSLLLATTKKYIEWAENWLNGTDRSTEAAAVAHSARSAHSYAAFAVSYVASARASHAASYSANAVASTVYAVADVNYIDFIYILNECGI
jgi:hypothetical protein